jgi:hypothetical protein
MTTSRAPGRSGARSRVIAVIAAVLGVSLLATGAIWAANRNATPSAAAGSTPIARTGFTVSVTPTPSSPATAKNADPKAAPKAKAKPAAKAAPKTKTQTAPKTKTPAKKATGADPGSTVVKGRKLPAGVVEPGRKIVAPVDVAETAVAASVRVDLTAFKAVRSEASGIGEISAPAVRITIRLTNTGGKSLALNYVVVNAYYGSAGTPGVLVSGDPASKPFAGSLKPGAKASAVVVFNMPVSKRSDVTITVSPSPTLPIAVFAGSVA